MALSDEHAAAEIKPMRTDDDQLIEAIPKQKLARYRKFAFRVFLILAPVHLYVGWRLLPDLPVDAPVRLLGGGVLAASAAVIPYGTLARVFVRNLTLVDILTWAGSLAMGWFSSLFILTLIRDAASLVPGVRAWSVETATLVLAMSLAMTLIGFFNARRLANVVHVDIPLDNLPPGLDGFTIAQITDIHVGSTIKGDYVRGIVARVNALNPDMIAITGDVVDGSVRQLAKETAPLARLTARHGAYVVTGNHEYYSGADEWMAEFRRLGLRTLMNQHVVIDHDGAKLVVAGVNDFSAGGAGQDFSAGGTGPALGSDPEAALSGSPGDVPKILLAHQPRSAPAAEAAGFDLQLSGHTHGGQFWPWNYFVRMQQPYTAGLHRLKRLWVYTSRGTGYWGPPKRFGAPSEITLIRLSTAAVI